MITTRWWLCVTMETSPSTVEDAYTERVIDVFYIFNSTVIDWTCILFFSLPENPSNWFWSSMDNGRASSGGDNDCGLKWVERYLHFPVWFMTCIMANFISTLFQTKARVIEFTRKRTLQCSWRGYSREICWFLLHTAIAPPSLEIDLKQPANIRFGMYQGRGTCWNIIQTITCRYWVKPRTAPLT